MFAGVLSRLPAGQGSLVPHVTYALRDSPVVDGFVGCHWLTL